VKKVLFSALVLAMVFGFSSAALGAAGDIAPAAFSDIAGNEAEGALTALGALGIFTGESGLGGAVKPNDPITRAQFSKIVVTAMGRGSTALGLMGLRPTFADEVPTWAWGYVNVAVYMGVINGYGDGTFGANKPVTYAESVTMLVRAVAGHKNAVPAGIWPYNFVFYAVDNQFTGGVDVGFTSLPCTRGDMAIMTLATMQVDPLVGKDLEPDLDGAILEDGIRLFEGTLSSYGADTVTIATYGAAKSLADPVYIVGAAGYEGLKMNPVLAIASKSIAAGGKVLFLEKVTGSAVIGAYKKTGTDTGTTDKYIQLIDGTKVYFKNTVPVNLNQAEVSAHDVSATPLVKYDELTINTDKDGKAVQIYALRWDLVNDDPYDNGYWDYVKGVDKSKVVGTTKVDTKVTFYDTSAYQYDDDPLATEASWHGLSNVVINIPKTAAVTINGASASRDDLAKADLLKVATLGAFGYNAIDTTVIAVSATRSVVEGVVTSVRNVTTVDGPATYATLKVGDTSKEYLLDGTYVATATVGDKNKYAIDEASNLFFNLGFVAANPIVLLTGASFVDVSGSDNDKWFLTVDEFGVEKTYETTSGIYTTLVSLADSEHFFVLTVNGANGKVEEATQPGAFVSDYEVKSVGTDNLTVGSGTTFYFLAAPVSVYSLTDDGYEFIGLAGLSANPADPDVVDVLNHNHPSPLKDWWLVIRDDQTTT